MPKPEGITATKFQQYIHVSWVSSLNRLQINRLQTSMMVNDFGVKQIPRTCCHH